MPGEIIDQPNPQLMPSHVPAVVDELAVKLAKTTLRETDYVALRTFRRAANYIAAAMIFLRDNIYLERDLAPEDIKPRLLGHWGTCPGLNFVLSHTNFFIRKNDLKALFIIGPGHGAPAALAAAWLEGSLEKFYPEYPRDAGGLKRLISTFSTTAGFPSHINALVPGSIHEGGELGYALGVAWGAVMDYPDLLAVVVVGDGECESGPTATAWHAAKFIDPAESGAVLPIVHLNGFKISQRTVYGCMDNRELLSLFTGYGYQPRIVEDIDDIDTDMNNSMEWALGEIKKIQLAARSGKPIIKPLWPVILVRTPKGWTGPTSVHGQIIEGSFKAHQVPLPNVKKSSEERGILQEWLLSYRPGDLFKEDGSVVDDALGVIPIEDSKKLGQTDVTYRVHHPLKVPDWSQFATRRGTFQSSMGVSGNFIDQVFIQNPHTVRLFCPDELESNKLDGALKHTGRNCQWDQFTRAQGGRVIEILSEHTCQAFLQGYTLTGRTAIFPSYESFLGIISTMMVQFCKFNKIAHETNWRCGASSINYIETSTWTRQEHNGFSHQNPSFISTVLNLKPQAARVYLPPDANTFLSTLSHCLKSKNLVNLMVGAKQPTPVFLSPEEATTHCRAGGSVWKFASTDEGLDPDVVIVGIGTELTFEVVQAAALLRRRIPELRVRVVNVTDLMILEASSTHPHALSDDVFDALFTHDRPVHFNYHGYAVELRGLLFGRKNLERVSIASYMEEGSTTTPFDMMLANCVSRFHVAQAAVRGAAQRNERVRLRLPEHIAALGHDIKQTVDYILETFEDPDGMYDMPTFT